MIRKHAVVRPIKNHPVTPRAGLERRTTQLYLVYATWIVVLLDPQWWVVDAGLLFARKIPTMLFVVLFAATLFSGRWRNWYPPLLALIVFVALTVPVAWISQATFNAWKQLVVFYILAVGTFTFVRTPRQAVPIIMLLLLFQFVWWGVHGAKSGLVSWHPSNANYDGFGPLMAIGITSCAYLGLAARSRKLRLLAFGCALVCTLGLISSFARGAVLGAAAVLGFAWLRSPKKGIATAGIVVITGTVVLAASTVFADVSRGTDTNRNFFSEMSTVSKDVNEGTGKDRRVLWAVARMEFFEHPVIGVGANNFGAYAATNFTVGDVGGEYAENPKRLYERALHSSYFQVLSELGTVGSLIFLWILVDFWRRNRALQSRSLSRIWSETTGGELDLRYIALGLESGMVAFLATAFFYNQLFNPWLYAILIANTLLHSVVAAAAKATATAPQGKTRGNRQRAPLQLTG